MLIVHILNAGIGDSIIIEYRNESGVAYGLIDSNKPSKDSPPFALHKLHELGVDDLSFIALTHPHLDHYYGLSEIIETYQGRIKSFYSFPLDHHKQGKLKKLAEIYLELCKDTDSHSKRHGLREFIQILVKAKKYIGDDNWFEPIGPMNQIAPEGFKGLDIFIVQPFRKSKGIYFRMIEEGGYDVVEPNLDENDLSLAFMIRYKGITIVLGGDTTVDNWRYRKRMFSDRIGEIIGSTGVKMPHHGSKKDCKPDIIDYLFAADGNRFGFISCNGRYPHPHPDVLKSLFDRDIRPVCTNISDSCIERRGELKYFQSDIDPKLLRYLNSLVEEDLTIQPCQGNIKIEIHDDGNVSLISEFEHPCVYSKDWSFIDRI